MNEAALAVWRKGHVPIIGVNLLADHRGVGGDASADAEIMMPLSCVGGAVRCVPAHRRRYNRRGSEMARFVAAGKPVFGSVDEIAIA